MALILTSRTPWRIRPSGIAVPHAGSHAYAGLVGWWYWDGALARDGLTGAGFVPTGTSSSDVDPSVGQFLNTATDAYVATAQLGPSGTPGLSVSAWVLVPSIANNATIIGARGNGWKFGVNGASAGDPLRLTFFGVADQDSSASGIGANTWTHVAVTYDKVNVRFFLNGKLISSHARTTAIGDTGIYPFFLSAYNNNGSPAENAGCRLVDVRYYQRGRSDGEVWEDYDPATRWSLYAPPVRRVYVQVPASGNTSAPGKGTLTATGYAPTVTQQLLSLPGKGTLAATGYAPTVSVTSGLTSLPGKGTVTATGYVPAVTQQQISLPGKGTLTATGYAPSVTVTAAGAITPGKGTLTATGYAPTLTQQMRITLGAGTVAATGYAPSVSVAVPIAYKSLFADLTLGTPDVDFTLGTPSVTFTMQGGA